MYFRLFLLRFDLLYFRLAGLPVMVPLSMVQPCVCLKSLSTTQMVRSWLRNMPFVCSCFFVCLTSSHVLIHHPQCVPLLPLLLCSLSLHLPSLFSPQCFLYLHLSCFSPQYFRCISPHVPDVFSVIYHNSFPLSKASISFFLPCLSDAWNIPFISQPNTSLRLCLLSPCVHPKEDSSSTEDGPRGPLPQQGRI